MHFFVDRNSVSEWRHAISCLNQIDILQELKYQNICGPGAGGSSGRGQGTGGSSQKVDKRGSDRASLSTDDFQRGSLPSMRGHGASGKSRHPRGNVRAVAPP